MAQIRRWHRSMQSEDRMLKKSAGKQSVRKISRRLGRTEGAVRQRASSLGLSLALS